MNTYKLIAGLVFLAVSAACSGPGESGNGLNTGIQLSPLIVAERVNVVEAQPDSNSGSSKTSSKTTVPSLKALLLGKLSSELPATSDYMTDVSKVYVNERSTKAFEEINGILCSIKQTRYDAMINQGPYKVLVDNNLCWNQASNSTDQSSGSTTPNYQVWTVNSRRASETSPHIVDIWFDESYEDFGEGGLVEQSVKAQVIITEGVDTAPPYGKFQLNYIVSDTNFPYAERSRGLLRSVPEPQTGEALLQFAEEDPDFTRIKKSTLQKNTDGTGGGTVLSIENVPPEAVRFDIAFNTTHFLRHNYDGNADVCLDRVNFDDSAWRYGLYDQSGKRINVNAGFTIKRGSEYGWIGYWGYWMPEHTDGTPGTITNGEPVLQHDFATNTDTPYTVFQSGGKLKKHTKKNLQLKDIKSIPLYWNDGGTNYLVVWEKNDPLDTAAYFFKVAAEIDGNWTTITPTLLDLSQLTLYTAELNFWSQSLGGQVRVSLANCMALANSYSCPSLQPDDAGVIFYAEEIVHPGDPGIPSTLTCYDRCLQTADISGIDPTVSSSLFYHDTWDDQNYTSTKVDYTFTSNPTGTTGMVLMEGSNPVILASAPTDSSYQGGVSSGPLISAATPTTTLACDWDDTKTCGWKTWSLDEFYTWETGPNSWNKFTALKDSADNFVQFDPPLRVAYTHAQTETTRPDYKYDGAVFNLEYNGFGNLSGIPGVCVDMDSGAKADCGQNTRWVPEFTIPDVQPAGAPNAGNLTEVTGPNSVQYIVKALEKEQRMRKFTDTVPCTNSGLAEAAPYPLPSMTLWKMPTNGPNPNVTTDPKVIGGVVQ